MIITSLDNSKIKQAIKLRESRDRKKEGLIIIEGAREISLAVKSGIEIKTFFYSPELAGKKEIPAEIKKKDIFEVTENVFKKISMRENPDGFLAVAIPKVKKIDEIKLNENPLVIILENIEKPGNLGAILRSADAAGADAVIVIGHTDIYNPNAIRASQGTVFAKQIAIGTNDEVIEWLKKKNIKIYATTPAADKDYTRADFKGPAAIVMGSEDRGLSQVWLEMAEEKIKIRMKGVIDSLNVSVSLAIILFEALRQRQ